MVIEAVAGRGQRSREEEKRAEPAAERRGAPSYPMGTLTTSTDF